MKDVEYFCKSKCVSMSGNCLTSLTKLSKLSLSVSLSALSLFSKINRI